MTLSVILLPRAWADSGGRLMREQAAYDVKFYSLALRIDPASHTIGGSVLVRAVALDTLSQFVLDLNANYHVDSVKWKAAADTLLAFTFTGGRIWAALPRQLSAGDSIAVEVYYYGLPRVSTNPPWDDGFVWTTSGSGKPWAGVACETEGGDCWWPCKDHPSDEPDSVALAFTVPSNLVCVANGKLVDTVDHHDGWKTFRWSVSNPINNYGVTFYLGEFVRIPVSYTSITGEVVPSEYWFLPEHKDTAMKYIARFLMDMRFIEETCGPYPFRADKYCIVEAPYWGMEHQTCIAYGNNFQFNAYGFDYIHYHEFSHEWWGNLVTAKDWSDIWLHEGFACYMEALYAEHLDGFARYKDYMHDLSYFSNNQAVAPRETLTANEGFNGPIYSKGAWILHTLRHLIGDSTFFRLLHRWTYPDSAMERVTDGRQCRLATTDDFLHQAEFISGEALDWFFEVYLRHTDPPHLAQGIVDSTLYLRWYTQNSLPFSLPVDVRLGASTIRVDMTGGSGHIAVPHGITPAVDPDAWILMSSIPAVSLSKSIIYFKGVDVDSSKTDSMTVTNTWATALTVSSASSDLPEFTVSPSSASIPPGVSQKFYVTYRPVSGVGKMGHIVIAHNAPGSPLTVTVTGFGILPNSTYGVSKSWNIVSVPLTRTDPRPAVLFPGAVSAAFAYDADSGYAAADTLRAGRGYWLKFDADQTVTISGFPFAVDTIGVKAGWNLIGSVSRAIPASSVSAIGTTVRTQVFGYRTGYEIADSIRPARGYWVKVDSAGKLIIGAPGVLMKPGGNDPAPNTLTISDRLGNRQTLSFDASVMKEPDPGRYEMPPKAPRGGFDARFSSGRIREFLGGEQSMDLPITVSSAEYPITVSWELSAPLAARLLIGRSEMSLRGSGKTVVGDEKAGISLLISRAPDVPKVYALHQNYPNPFNPATSIRFELPSESRVSLRVFNILGEEVATLIDGTRAAGSYSVWFDGTNLPSGLYMCRMHAGDFSKTIKILMLK